MDADESRARAAVVAAARDLDAQGLNRGTSGNVSLRWRDGLLITPSGVPSARIGEAEVVFLAMDGGFDHPLSPSSEWRFHRDILREKPAVNAVVHAHPDHGTAFAMCRQTIPAVHYMIAAVGGPTIRCSGYATFGTEELSRLALEALEDRNGCLLANHGMIATGPDLPKALWLAVEMETLCRQYAVALQVGTPVVLPDAEIARNIEKFRSYGPRTQASDR
ncbi:5-(methylthio)ribulose-1-phosphate aldolase [Methylobacterium cerastii]|uniref:5-(Methylthio)ribulose-1-phosphate aldolase n=1 Tax=Methylobacterium cerastii TaxID=932741 RepID=A0ABQ4QNA5_9HYPH|nr:class II aldolase/adducin family protein [Methylobacterium cerastii]GJD46737.1 5-(methylthio)ribulose-1-phosphate aldolase [Methylobacterium cerastii]